MKKIFLALAAVAALAACTKTEAQYEPTGEISFAPVVSNRTKAMQTETTFPEEAFNVWAWYKQVNSGTTIIGWQNSAEPQQNYIIEKPFAKQTNGLWGGDEASYFWPKIGSLMFAGYYPTTIAEQVSYKFTSTENVMTIINYVPGFVTTNTTHEEDLMYFHMTDASCQNTTVEVEFKHALSWVDVVLVKADGTPADAKITVNSVSFENIIPFGNATVNNSAVGASRVIQWTPHGDPKSVVVTETAGHVIDANAARTPLVKQPLFIPQPMTSLVVNYTIASIDGSQFTETKTITLSTLVSGHSAWKPGKKYTYTISIGTTEIFIEPTVAEWESVPMSVQI